MELDPRTVPPNDFYRLLIGCIVPRPIAWVATMSVEGQTNLAPFSFFNGVGSAPPALMLSINASTRPGTLRKDTLRNIEETGEFVVNVVTEATAAAMNETATDYPAEVDEFAAAGLTRAPSVTVRPPRVAESPVHFECAVHALVPVGDGPGRSTVVIGLVQHVAVRDDLLDERNRVLIERLKPIGRLAGNSYAYVHETFELVRKRLH